MHVAGDRSEVRAAVFRQVQRARERVHTIRIQRIDTNIRIVERPEIDVRIAVDHAPVRARVVAAPQLAFVLRFRDHVDDVRIARRHGEADAVHLFLWQPALRILSGKFFPSLTAVHGLPHARVTAARLEMPRPSPVGIHPSVHDIGVVGVGGNIRTRGLLVDVQHFFPVLSTIGALEHAAFFIGSPLAAEPTRIDDVRIFSINDDAGDLVTFLETDVRPVLAGVDRLEHPNADRRVVPRILFSRAHIDDIRIAWRDRDGSDRTRVLPIKYRLEGCPAVRRLDDAPVGTSDVVDVRIARDTGDDRHAAGLICGPDRAPLDLLQRLLLRGPVRRHHLS